MALSTSCKAIAAVIFILMIPASASAQTSCSGSTCDDEAAAAASLYSTTTTGGGITTTAVVAAGVYLTMRSADKGSAMRTFLKENAVALEGDLTIGAGSVVDDLALAFGVASPDRAAFGRALREHRATLLELADPSKLTNERALQFADLVVRIGDQAGLISAS